MREDSSFLIKLMLLVFFILPYDAGVHIVDGSDMTMQQPVIWKTSYIST